MPIDIKQKRIEHGLTLEQLGKIVGVSKSTIKKWESGYIKNMKRNKIVALADALGVSPLELLDIPEGSSPADKISIPLDDKHRSLIEHIFNISVSENTVIYFTDNNICCCKFSPDSLRVLKSLCDQVNYD